MTSPRDPASATPSVLDRRTVAVIVLVGLALRVVVARAPGTSFADLPRIGVIGIDGRALSFLAEVAAWWLTALVLKRAGRRTAARLALAIGALDPLGIVAAADAGASITPAIAGICALAIACGRGLPERAAGAVGYFAMVVDSVAPLRVGPGAIADPWPLAWSDDPRIGAWCAGLNHFGWMAFVLAAFGLVRSPLGARPLLAFLLAAVAFSVRTEWGDRLAAFVVFAPALVCGAALSFAAIAERGPAAARVLLTLVVLANAPTLVSDARGGLRFPTRAAIDRLTPEDRGARIVSPSPELFAGTGVDVRALDGSELPAIDAAANPAQIVIVPVLNERACGSPQSVLDAIERLATPAFEARVPRFDLYRAELRVYRLGAARR